MLENLRRKSLTKTYIDPQHQVALELGYAHYKNHLSVDQYKQKFSKKKITKLFPNPFTQISKDFSLVPFSLENVKFNMIVCLSGTFRMGHKSQEDNKPRTVIIDRSFLLGETEITQELYERVMGDNPSRFKGKSQNPVEQVSWYDAILFCNELSRLQGLDECYVLKDISTKDRDGVDQNRIMSAQVTCDFGKNGYRLPTEEEWEYAAKAGTQNQWAGTDDKSKLYEYAWFYEEQSGFTHPVATRKPNEWGLYDMSGNVNEWCWSNYYAYRVHRGGSCFTQTEKYLCSAYRSDHTPGGRNNALGFRVARSIVN